MTLSDERLREIEEMFGEGRPGSLGTSQPFAVKALRELLAEVHRLRALPVLRTCGGCAWATRGHLVCDHPDASGSPLPEASFRVHRDQAPPAWCPMRKESR